MNVDDYIDELGDQGQLDSSHHFTIDPVAALRKYRDLLKAHPVLHIVKLIQAGVALGATSVEVTNPADYIRVLYHLPRHSPQLDGLAQPAAPVPEQLRIPLQLALATQPAALDLFYVSPQGGWVGTLGQPKRPQLAETGSTRFAITIHRKSLSFWGRLLPDAETQKELSSRCGFATVPITLDGRRLNGGGFRNLPGLEYPEMPRGSLLQRSQFDSRYPVLAAHFSLERADSPGLAVTPPLRASSRLVRLEGTPTLFPASWPVPELGVAHYQIPGAAQVHSVTERTRDDLAGMGTYYLTGGIAPQTGALWLHTRASLMQTVYESKYLPETDAFWLPHLRYFQPPAMDGEFRRYWSGCSEKQLFAAPMLNAARILLMRALPAAETVAYFVDHGVVLNPIRFPSRHPGMVVLQRADGLQTDASFLTPVHTPELLARCEAAQSDYDQLCKDMHRLVTTVSELNLPQPTIELWRQALAIL